MSMSAMPMGRVSRYTKKPSAKQVRKIMAASSHKALVLASLGVM